MQNRSRKTIDRIIDALKGELDKPQPEDTELDATNVKNRLKEISEAANSKTLFYTLFGIVTRHLMFQIGTGCNELKPLLIASSLAHDSKLFGQIDYVKLDRIKYHLPALTVLDEIIRLIVRYYHAEGNRSSWEDFDSRFKFIRESIEPYVQVAKTYGDKWVNRVRFQNLVGLRLLISSKITEKLSSLNSINAQASTSLTMRKTNYTKRIGLYRFRNDQQEGVFTYLTSLYNCLPLKEGLAPTVHDLRKIHGHALNLLSTYPNFRTNMFSGFFLGEPIPYLEYWVRRDRLFSAGQNNPNATAFLANHLFPDWGDVSLWSYLFACLHRYGALYTTQRNLEFDVLTFATKIGSMSERQRKRICNRFYLEDPGSNDTTKVLDILYKMSDEIKVKEDNNLLPHKIRSPINADPPLIRTVKKGDYKLRNNATPFTANWLLEHLFERGLVSNTGAGFERAVRSIFRAIGFNVISGNYFYEKRWYECDCILVEGDQIYSFELKMKPLTRKSRTGDTASLLRDLLLSFLSATNQSMRFDVALQKEQRLTIFDRPSKKANAVAVLEFHSGRTRFKSFCMTPVGMESFCQPVVSSNLLQIFLQWDFELPHQSDKDQSQVNRIQEDFKNLVREMQTMASEPRDALYSIVANSSFISFDELYILATIARNKQSFIDIFKTTMHMQESSFKLYNKILQALRLSDYKKSPEFLASQNSSAAQSMKAN